ncbi:unnamed protein product [Arctia plantaginis]|uniref:Uncharacterized protein n=1 Tax=Arctia plantaginis TaxID=874455 RepID=A0A8S0Z6Z5_ARCPL|nr:unnamed protein product [Arctia plantaginis]
MILILLLCVTQMVCGKIYYHEHSIEKFQPPNTLREDSYFGYSITYDIYNRRMIISAPRESDIGVVYTCDLSTINNNSCSRIAVNITREDTLYTHDYWFGATVKAGPNFLVACTPRYSSYINSCDFVGIFGRCYVRKEIESNFSSHMAPEPIAAEYDNKGVCVHHEKKMDSLGWCLDIGEDSSIIVGSPILFNNTGIAAIRPVKTDQDNVLIRLNNKEKNIYNLGYSVAIGHFMSEEILSYAVSTTYGTVGPGKIYFYSYTNGLFSSYITLNKSIDVEVVGSMFGAVLCKAKINEFGKGDDLLVGAPTYALDTGYNTGAVYVYAYNTANATPVFRRKIVGYKSGSLFGSAIISVGDLNGDRKDEIAIGAPFEDGGAVYLYSGASIFSTDKTLNFLQKIKPTEKNLQSFGFSMTALQDYDHNGCNELAISAPYSDRVLLYKCLASVTISKLYAVFPDVKNRTVSRKTDYIFQVCMDVQYPEKPKAIVADLSTDVKMYHKYATLKNLNNQNFYTFKKQLQSKNKKYCENIEFVLPLDKDYSMEVEYKLTTTLLNNPMDLENVNDSHVILTDYSKLSYSGSFWAGECSGPSKCISNLTLTVTSDITIPLIIGSRNKGAFHIEVLNTGDVAYDPCIQFSISGGNVQSPPMYCSHLKERWSCTSMKPIKTNGTWEIRNIIVDLRDLTNEDRNVTLNLNLFNRCTDTNNSKVYQYSIPLKSRLDGVYIKGITDVGDTVDIIKDDVLLSKHFKHIYTITNKGPTNFKHLTATVVVQKIDFVAYSDVPVSIYIKEPSLAPQSTNNGIECKVNANNAYKITAICPIHSLFKDNYVRVVVSLETNPDVLTYDVLKKRSNIEVNSVLSIQFDNTTSRSFSITTLIHLQEAFVNIWISIVAGLVGLLLIIILAIVLYKSGFLRRKNKERLKDLKKKVKSQSIRRSMVYNHLHVETANGSMADENTQLRAAR